jgi:lipoyl(octanoyl) transferase
MADQVSGRANPRLAFDPARSVCEGVEWLRAAGPVEYPAAVAFMEQRVEAIARGSAPEAVWLLHHPPLYTAGTSACDEDLLDPGRFPVFRTGRGGRFTYHGPGQRVAYVMLDLRGRGTDVRAFVHGLEEWLIEALGELGVQAGRSAGNVGVWVESGDGCGAKIAAIGVRVRRWVSYHGIALNVDPDLSHFGGIVPCGLHRQSVTSIAALGLDVDMPRVDEALRRAFGRVFGG